MCYIVAIIRDRIQELLGSNPLFSRLRPMTATQISPQPGAGISPQLVCRPLVTMASRGFDVACLSQMQDAAFRYAAQSLQNNRITRAPGASLLGIVDQQLGGPGQADADVSPGHLAAYMAAKAFFSQFRQRDALFDVAVLATAPPTTGSLDPRLNWLARTLVGLQQDADRLAVTTPMFAAEIATHVRRTVAKRAELDGLAQAMRTLATRVAASTDEDQMEAEAHPAPPMANP